MNRMIKRFAFLTMLLALFGMLTVTAWASETNEIDPSLVLSSETRLDVYADDTWNAERSGSYGFGDKATITAPDVSGKTFSHWEADASVISYDSTLTLTMNAHTTLYAVYGNAAPTKHPVAGFTSITRTNDGEKLSFQAIASGETAGIVYSTTVTGEDLKIGSDGVTNVEAEKLTDSTTTMPKSVLDSNNCWMLQITPESGDTVYHARAYVTENGSTTYGDEKSVKLSELQSGVTLVANLEGFVPGTDDALRSLASGQSASPATVTKAPTAKDLTYNGKAQELVTAGTVQGGTMQYALRTDAATAPTTGYSTSIPTATDEGTCIVWYRVIGDADHADVAPASVEVSIKKSPGEAHRSPDAGSRQKDQPEGAFRPCGDCGHRHLYHGKDREGPAVQH